VTLVFEGPVTYLSKPVEEHRSCQRVPGFALVETGGYTPPQRWIFDPSQHEEGPLDSSDLAQRKGKAVLTRVGTELAKNQGCRDCALLDGCGQSQDFAKLLSNDPCIDGATDHGAECLPLCRLARHVKTLIRQVAYAGREPEAEQVTESEDVIGEAGGIGVVLLDPQLGLVIEQAIEHMRRIAHGGVNDLGMEGCVLIGDMSVEGDTGVIPIFRVHLAGRFAAAARAVALTIGRGRGSFAPMRSERNAVLMVDDFGQSF